MKKNSFKLVLIFIFINFLCINSLFAIENKDLISEIVLLKRLSKKAYFSDKLKIESIIEKLKNEKNIKNSVKQHFGENIFQNLLAIIPLIIWQVLFLISWFFFLFYLKNFRSFYIIFFRFIFLLLTGIMVAWGYYSNILIEGIINKDKAPLYLGPGFEYPQKGFLNFLDNVLVKKKYDSWYYINTSLYSGWIHAQDIEVV